MNITVTSSTVIVIKLRTPSSQQNIFPVISAAHQFKFIVAIIINTHDLDYRLQFHQVRRYAKLDVLVGIKKLLPNVTSRKISRGLEGTNAQRTFFRKNRQIYNWLRDVTSHSS